jgi:hypothetical protein
LAVRIEATRTVAASREAIFEYLASLENHWRLADRWIEVVTLERAPEGAPLDPPDRGRVRMRGPVGLRRTAATRVVSASPPGSIAGIAEIGRRTRARVSWTLGELDGATAVRLEAEVETAGALDRLLLTFGGIAWLRRRFRSVLERLAQRFAAQ